ncbi:MULTISPECIES: hypothetical protein [Sphingobacterium]|uniref:hypothetical protein n=1 Tax=Sphingobacterium TaxID=28453 RepID=UPI0028A86D51|nr:hypothetical protein [Sphingobacterium multivorum]
MKLFNGNKEKREAIRPLLTRTIKNAYRKTQTGWVKVMKRWTRNFSRRTWMVVLVIYAVWAICLCGYIILIAIR